MTKDIKSTEIIDMINRTEIKNKKPKQKLSTQTIDCERELNNKQEVKMDIEKVIKTLYEVYAEQEGLEITVTVSPKEESRHSSER